VPDIKHAKYFFSNIQIEYDSWTSHDSHQITKAICYYPDFHNVGHLLGAMPTLKDLTLKMDIVTEWHITEDPDLSSVLTAIPQNLKRLRIVVVPILDGTPDVVQAVAEDAKTKVIGFLEQTQPHYREWQVLTYVQTCAWRFARRDYRHEFVLEKYVG
jgi:hypothetical protein